MQNRVVVDGELRNVCPVDLRPLTPVPVSTDDEIRATIQAARVAQFEWSTMDFETRVRLLKKAAKRMIERRQEAMAQIHDEAGKTPAEILMSEALGPLQYVSDWAKVVRPYLGAKRVPISPLAFPGKSGTVTSVPRGVVAIISPWNYPMANFFKPLFPALLCGNSVVIKPSEYSPRTAAWFASVINEFIPSGVLGVVQGDREVGQKLVRGGVDAVTFTGSFLSGREVAKLAAEQMIPISCELGGKDAAIVLGDCDLDRTVAGIMHWALHNSGQACGAIDRVYVEESIADAFVARLGQAVSSLRSTSGDPNTSDVGPLVHDQQLRVVEEHVADALARGAKLVAGGKRAGKGLYHEPTVLDRCNHSMRVCVEPTFGPIIPVVRVKDAEQAVALANDSGYGLNGSVWSGDRKRAAQLASRLRVGTAFVNNHAFTGAIAAAPWTGTGQSGYGIANSAFALNHYTRPFTQVMDRGKDCDAWWFPVNGTLEELGQRLGDAQTGKLLSAIKIPLLISRRKKEVLRYAQGVTELVPAAAPRPESLDLNHVTALAWGWLTRKLRFKLGRRERRWAQAFFETAFLSPPNVKALPTLPPDHAVRLVDDMLLSAPLLACLGLRLSIWLAGLAPIPVLRRLKTIDRLSQADRLRIAEALYRSNRFLIRQMVYLLKTVGAFSYSSTSRFQSVMRPRTAELRQPDPAHPPVGAAHDLPLAPTQPVPVSQGLEV